MLTMNHPYSGGGPFPFLCHRLGKWNLNQRLVLPRLLLFSSSSGAIERVFMTNFTPYLILLWPPRDQNFPFIIVDSEKNQRWHARPLTNAIQTLSAPSVPPPKIWAESMISLSQFFSRFELWNIASSIWIPLVGLTVRQRLIWKKIETSSIF